MTQTYSSKEYLSAAQTLLKEIEEETKTAHLLLQEKQAEKTRLAVEAEKLRQLIKANKEALLKTESDIHSTLLTSASSRSKKSLLMEQYKNEYARLYREECLREAQLKASNDISQAFSQLTLP